MFIGTYCDFSSNGVIDRCSSYFWIIWNWGDFKFNYSGSITILSILSYSSKDIPWPKDKLFYCPNLNDLIFGLSSYFISDTGGPNWGSLLWNYSALLEYSCGIW